VTGRSCPRSSSDPLPGAPTLALVAEKEQRDADPAAPDVSANGSGPDEEPARRRFGLGSRGRRKWRWPSVLRITGWQDMAALAAVLTAAAGAGAWAWDRLTAEDPWQDRADQICLRYGDEYLNVDGSRQQQLRERIAISRSALGELEDLRSDVPTASQLSYSSVLSDKQDMIAAMERKLALIEAGKPTGRVDERVDGAWQLYQIDAEQVGLSACGQATGMQ
jgi:hypothetical protein